MCTTCQYESDKSKEYVAAPEDDAREDDVSDKRLDAVYNNWLPVIR